MNIADRKLRILEAVVESYISTGEPVGSKAVCGILDFAVSSATVRNDMAELTELGLIEQPYTSAGRIPSSDGYRVYVSKLMKIKAPSSSKKEYIRSLLTSAGDEPGHILSSASKLLSELTGCVAVVSTPPGDESRIYRLKFLQTSKHTGMVVLIASSGLIKSRLFRCDYVVTPEVTAIYERILNDKFSGLPLKELTPALLQTVAASMGQLALLMPNVLWAVAQSAKDAVGTNIFVHGVSNLLMNSGYDIETARKITELVGNRDKLTDLLNSFSSGEVLIGRENKIKELEFSSLITAKYNVGDYASGCAAIIGPMRINYAEVIPLIDYVSQKTGELISELSECD